MLNILYFLLDTETNIQETYTTCRAGYFDCRDLAAKGDRSEIEFVGSLPRRIRSNSRPHRKQEMESGVI